MYPVTQTFLDNVRAGGYVRTSEVDVYFNGNFVATLPIADGVVEVDRTADTRRSCTITVADESFIPQFVNSPLAPYGAELVVRSGIAYSNGQRELSELGVFRVEQVDWQESSGGLPKVTAYDRSKAVQDANMLFPIDFSGGSAFDLFTRFIQNVIDTTVNISPALMDFRMPGGTVCSSNRWATMQDIAKAMGAEIFFDVHGNVVVQPIPGLTQDDINSATPVWEVNVGANGVLVDASRTVSRTGVANAIAVSGASSGTGATPMGWAADHDPRSPTYWGPAESLPYGPYIITPFGEVVSNITNQLCTTNEQCTIAALGELKKTLGLARSLDFTSVWNPALQEGDIVRLTYLNGAQELHIIDKLHIPIGSAGDAMTASTRTLTYQFPAGT